MPTSRALLAAFALAACTTPQATSSPPPTAPATALASSSASPAASAATADPHACGDLGCRLYDSELDAFRAILAKEKPLVLAVGEAHAQKGSEAIASSAKRFTVALLPELKGRASDLLVELMAPPAGCAAKSEKVKTQQKEVTQHQAAEDQNEYVTMGNEAKKLGVIPDLLRPTCGDLDAIQKSPDGPIAASLSTIARLTKEKAKDLLGRNAKDGVDKIVVTYGGAMHNDISPAADRRDWSFGPDLSTATGGRYVELDLFVADFVTDSDSWKKQVWYGHFDRAAHPGKTTVFEIGPRSYVMIIPGVAAKAPE